MFLAPEDFIREFQTEGQYPEFKQGVSHEKIQDAIVAFSNKDGGVVLIGVRNDGTVSGVVDTGEAERQLQQAAGSVNYPGRYTVHHLAVGDKNVLVLSVARRREGFAQTPSGIVKIRSGASNTALIGEQLSRFMRERAFSHFETTRTPARLDAASPARLDRLRREYAWPDGDVTDLLIDGGYAIRDQGAVSLTVVGGLFLLEDPASLGVRSQVEILRFPRDSDDPDKRTTIAGPVDVQVEEATKAILAELGELSILLGTRRIDLPKIPPTAIREAIANAVAHRSYEATGTGVRVEIRDTDVKIISPGPLPEPVTEENIRNQQAARNATLLGTLRRYGLAEDLGRGIDRIQDEMAAQLLHPPEFHDDGSSVTVVLKLSGLVTSLERAWLSRLVHDRLLQPNDLLVVVQAVRDGSIANSGVRSLAGVDHLEARSILHRLRDEGLLVQEGERGGAYYRPADGLGMPTVVRLTPEEIEERVMRLAADGPISNADVRSATGLDRNEARIVLQRLVAARRLSQIGARKGTRYEITNDAPRQTLG
jgi:ATP-dependent DNA helicase RecG